jgi:hypothetical protein
MFDSYAGIDHGYLIDIKNTKRKMGGTVLVGRGGIGPQALLSAPKW